MIVGDNINIGKYAEELSEKIKDDFTSEKLRQFLYEIIHGIFKYTEKDFKDWCERNRRQFMDVDFEDIRLEQALQIAEDVDCQWDLFIAKAFKIDELQKIDFYKIQLPKEYYTQWEKRLW